MGKETITLCTVEDIAEVTGQPVELLRDYASRGWFDGEVVDGVKMLIKGDSVFRCTYINHLRRHYGFSDDEIDGVIRYSDVADIARMGGGKQKLRLQPFESELAKAGPVWICVAQGVHAPGAPVHFAVHGRIDASDKRFLVVREDAMLAFQGEVETFELLGATYARGSVPEGLSEGTYRIHFGGCGSYPFTVSATAAAEFVAHGLRYYQGTRCGEETEYHPACHLDDGIRSDTGEYMPLVGGWHDAGDFCHITSTTTASYYLARALATAGVDFPGRDALYDEALHGADYDLRARDAATGKVFENKGVGRGRSPDGNFGDNQRLTDNIVLSGDERAIRTEGQIETAMDNIACLAVMARQYAGTGRFADDCRDASLKSWEYHAQQEAGGLHHPAKRFYAAYEWYLTTKDAAWLERARPHVDLLVAAVDGDGDLRTTSGRIFLGTHYQHGSPFLALALAAASDTDLADVARPAAIKAADRMLELAKLNPYGVTCYAVTRDEDIPTFTNQGTVNSWHPLSSGKSYRMYQPFTEKFWQGSASQLSVLGVACAILADATGDGRYRDLAARHFDWCVGCNPYQCCLVSAWGACEAAPLSTVVGYMPGGTIQGPIGDQDDVPYFQVGKGMRVGEEPLFNFAGPSYSREYWSPLSSALMWLRTLLP